MEERKCQDSASFTGTQSPEEGMVGDVADEKPHRGQAPTRENHLEGGVSRTAFLFSLPSHSALSPSQSASKQKSGQDKVVKIENGQ